MKFQVFVVALAVSIALLPVGGQGAGSSGAARTKRTASDLYNMSSSGSASAKKPVVAKASKTSKVKKSTAGYRKTTTVSEQPTSAPRTISSWPTGRKLVALTYDDGPNPKITPRLLELLHQKNAKGTFYLLGEQLREFPKTAAQIVASGDEVGNHTYDHKMLTGLSADGIRSELERTQDLLTSVAGHQVATMRPPGGAYNTRVREVADSMGYKVILWDVDTNDWRRPSTNSIIDNVLRNAHDGSIILMHDRYESTLTVTAAVIDGLRQRGFEFVTVSELVANERQTSSAKSLPQPAAQSLSTVPQEGAVSGGEQQSPNTPHAE